jgi:hemoglobin
MPPQAPESGPQRSDATRSDLERLGGEAGIRRWVDRFYDQVPADPLLAPLFPKDLAATRDKQFAFFVEFFGGPPLYTQQHGPAFLRFKHRKAKIGRPERDAWMKLMLSALKEQGADEDLIARVNGRLGPIATQMINTHPDKKDAYYFN